MQTELKLPRQCPPVRRELFAPQEQAKQNGVAASQTPCDNLTGMARQMCFASQYGVDT